MKSNDTISYEDGLVVKELTNYLNNNSTDEFLNKIKAIYNDKSISLPQVIVTKYLDKLPLAPFYKFIANNLDKILKDRILKSYLDKKSNILVTLKDDKELVDFECRNDIDIILLSLIKNTSHEKDQLQLIQNFISPLFNKDFKFDKIRNPKEKLDYPKISKDELDACKNPIDILFYYIKNIPFERINHKNYVVNYLVENIDIDYAHENEINAIGDDKYFRTLLILQKMLNQQPKQTDLQDKFYKFFALYINTKYLPTKFDGKIINEIDLHKLYKCNIDNSYKYLLEYINDRNSSILSASDFNKVCKSNGPDYIQGILKDETSVKLNYNRLNTDNKEKYLQLLINNYEANKNKLNGDSKFLENNQHIFEVVLSDYTKFKSSIRVSLCEIADEYFQKSKLGPEANGYLSIRILDKDLEPQDQIRLGSLLIKYAQDNTYTINEASIEYLKALFRQPKLINDSSFNEQLVKLANLLILILDSSPLKLAAESFIKEHSKTMGTQVPNSVSNANAQVPSAVNNNFENIINNANQTSISNDKPTSQVNDHTPKDEPLIKTNNVKLPTDNDKPQPLKRNSNSAVIDTPTYSKFTALSTNSIAILAISSALYFTNFMYSNNFQKASVVMSGVGLIVSLNLEGSKKLSAIACSYTFLSFYDPKIAIASALLTATVNYNEIINSITGPSENLVMTNSK